MSSPTPQQQMQSLLKGYRVTQMLAVAANLNLADTLAEGSKTIAELAAASGAQADPLYRVLRALASIGVFEEVAEERFALTPLASLLLKDHPDSMYAQAIFFGGESYRAWGELLHGVMTGETPFETVFGSGHFAYLAQHPASSAIFNQTMSANARRATADIVGAYPFPASGTVVDIGGGHGMLIAAILRANPALRGILFDEEHVVANAAPILDAGGVADRCACVGGDFFASVPSGDFYTLRHILHDWDDAHSVAILRNCAQAMAPDGRILVIESVIEPGNDPSPAKFLDLQMLVINGGRERTAEEYRRLFEAAGLALARIIPAGADGSVIEGRRATA